MGPLTDLITTINLPVVSAAEVARGNFFMEWGVSNMLSTLGAEIFVRKTVGELLFEGYEDKIMVIGSALGQGKADVVLDKFGFFYKVQATGFYIQNDLVLLVLVHVHSYNDRHCSEYVLSILILPQFIYFRGTEQPGRTERLR